MRSDKNTIKYNCTGLENLLAIKRLAQWLERKPAKLKVTGSSPVSFNREGPTNNLSLDYLMGPFIFKDKSLTFRVKSFFSSIIKSHSSKFHQTHYLSGNNRNIVHAALYPHYQVCGCMERFTNL